MAEPLANPLERRRTPRRRVNKFANLEFDDGGIIPGVVRNFSDNGALVMVRTSAGIPDEVVLVIPEDQFRRPARIRWRRARSVGLKFI